MLSKNNRARRAFKFHPRTIRSSTQCLMRFPGLFRRRVKVSAGILAVFRSARREERLTPCDLPADQRG